jgi:anion-transporting  ArsA/GET3 family ATPase
MLPTRGGLRVIGTATQPILKAIGKVVGSDVLADSVAFFQAFAGMETGFRERADDVVRLIRAPETSFVVVAAPRHDTIDEAVWFANQLVEQGVGVTSAIVNRAHPEFGSGSASDAIAAAAVARREGDETLGVLWDNVADLRTMRDLELAVIAPLAEIVGGERLVVLPLLDSDVHDLDGLMVIAAHLFDHPVVDR